MSMYHDQHVDRQAQAATDVKDTRGLRPRSQMCLSMDQNLVQVFLQRNTTLSSLRSYRQEVQCDYSTHMPLCASWSMGTIESSMGTIHGSIDPCVSSSQLYSTNVEETLCAPVHGSACCYPCAPHEPAGAPLSHRPPALEVVPHRKLQRRQHRLLLVR